MRKESFLLKNNNQEMLISMVTYLLRKGSQYEAIWILNKKNKCFSSLVFEIQRKTQI